MPSRRGGMSRVSPSLFQSHVRDVEQGKVEGHSLQGGWQRGQLAGFCRRRRSPEGLRSIPESRVGPVLSRPHPSGVVSSPSSPWPPRHSINFYIDDCRFDSQIVCRPYRFSYLLRTRVKQMVLLIDEERKGGAERPRHNGPRD